MKGIVFREFLEMVDREFSPALTETVICKSVVPSGGAYTSVGYYPSEEMQYLVSALSLETGVSVSQLLKQFGRYLMVSFTKIFPQYFELSVDILNLAENLDKHFHAEVRRLYDDAEVPELPAQRISDDEVILTYRSVRGMADLAEGLLEGGIAFYGHPVVLERTDLPYLEGGIQCAQFRLLRGLPTAQVSHPH